VLSKSSNYLYLDCDAGISSSDIPVSDGEWYIVTVAWSEPTGAAQGTLAMTVYDDSTPPEEVGPEGGVSCEGDVIGALNWTHWRQYQYETGSTFFDCLEEYDTDPGAPTAACNLRSD
jgi:hypothetical protein